MTEKVIATNETIWDLVRETIGRLPQWYKG